MGIRSSPRLGMNWSPPTQCCPPLSWRISRRVGRWDRSSPRLTNWSLTQCCPPLSRISRVVGRWDRSSPRLTYWSLTQCCPPLSRISRVVGRWDRSSPRLTNIRIGRSTLWCPPLSRISRRVGRWDRSSPRLTYWSPTLWLSLPLSSNFQGGGPVGSVIAAVDVLIGRCTLLWCPPLSRISRVVGRWDRSSPRLTYWSLTLLVSWPLSRISRVVGL